MTNNINVQEQNYKKPSAGSIIGGALAGSVVQGAVSTPKQIIAPLILEKVQKISRELTADEFTQVEKAVLDTIKNSGLEAKGVSVIKATSENAKEISEIMLREINNAPLFKYLPKKVKEFAGKTISSMIASGNNACYTFLSKKIIMPEKELNLSLFHEAGHAMNANLSKFGKILQKCRPMVLLACPISLIALFKTKKAPNQEPKNNLDKATTFIKDNAGKLTFAAFIPMLVEEGLASLKGNKFAKQLLSPELAKKVAKTNALGFSTYLVTATLSGLGIYLGAKVKDAIASNKPIEK